jgi:phage shock protein A
MLQRIEQKLDAANKSMEKIMATLDQVLADVTQETTDLDSIAALIAGLKQQIADALSGATLPPDVQAKVDSVFATAETNKGKIAAALAANTP